MIRILLSLAVAAAAFFGPWAVNSASVVDMAATGLIHGDFFAGGTVDCLLAQNFSIDGDCAPAGGLLGKAVTATVALGVVAGVLGILGLLPVIGRLTSIITVVAGLLAVATFGLFAKELMMADGGAFTDFRWGGYATGGFGLLAIFAGLGGMRGDD